MLDGGVISQLCEHLATITTGGIGLFVTTETCLDCGQDLVVASGVEHDWTR